MLTARRLISLLLVLFLISGLAASQGAPIRVVVLGSSTAEGVGAPAGKGWVALYKNYLASAGISSEVINLASAGYTTFDVLPTDFVSPYRSLNTSWNRAPDPQRNITKALSYAPTDIVVNLPSNDGLLEVPVTYQIAHLCVLQTRALAQGVRIWFTTSQPTKWVSTKAVIQAAMRDAVLAQFGIFAVDFWTGIATSDGKIQAQYDAGDGAHVNEKGHAVLFESAKNRISFTLNPPSVNTVADGGFETTPTLWAFATNGSGTFGTTAGGTQGAKAGKVAIQSAGTNVQLYQASIALQANTRYRLSFDAYSSSGHDVALSVVKHISPYTNYGLSNYQVNLGTTWQTFSIPFTTSGFTGAVSDARLMFWLTPYHTAGDEYLIDNVVLIAEGSIGTDVGETSSTAPSGFNLFQNYPNPFNPTTTIGYQLSAASDVKLVVYDLLGQEAATLVDENKPAGAHTVHFHAGSLASGVYLYQLKVEETIATRRMILIR